MKKKSFHFLSPSLYEHSVHPDLRLFDKPPTQEYIEEWTRSLSDLSKENTPGDLSVLIFRLGREWLALPTIFFQEVTKRRPMHKLPHRSNQILLGIVNLNGQFQLYVSLHQLLGIELPATSQPTQYKEDRMVAIVKEGIQWVFPVEEVAGIHRWNSSLLEENPLNLYGTLSTHLKGLLRWNGKHVGLLDEELVFSGLARSVR